MGVALKEIQTIILTYLRRPDKIITILLLDDPHRKELIQFDKGRPLYSQSRISRWQRLRREGVKEQSVSNFAG